MKRLSLLLLLFLSLTISAQMQVWSNGTIIFTHNVADVDSISFDGPMQVVSSSSDTTLVGRVYYCRGTSENVVADKDYTICFYDESHGLFNYTVSGHNTNNYYEEFTYVYNHPNITIEKEGRTITGYVIGGDAITLINFYRASASYESPTTFLRYRQ